MDTLFKTYPELFIECVKHLDIISLSYIHKTCSYYHNIIDQDIFWIIKYSYDTNNEILYSLDIKNIKRHYKLKSIMKQLNLIYTYQVSNAFKYINKLTNNSDYLINILQRYIFDKSDQLLIIYGQGHNGKGTFMNYFNDILNIRKMAGNRITPQNGTICVDETILIKELSIYNEYGGKYICITNLPIVDIKLQINILIKNKNRNITLIEFTYVFNRIVPKWIENLNKNEIISMLDPMIRDINIKK